MFKVNTNTNKTPPIIPVINSLLVVRLTIVIIKIAIAPIKDKFSFIKKTPFQVTHNITFMLNLSYNTI